MSTGSAIAPSRAIPSSICCCFCFLFVIITSAAAEEICSASTCGPVVVRFPFQLQESHRQADNHRCTYPGFNLSCSSTNLHSSQTILHLPNAGSFTVEAIDYGYQEIYISDPDGCLASRLLHFNLSGSPFRTINERSYVFFACPTADVANQGFMTLACLSSEDSTVIALPESYTDYAPKTCKEMERVRVPGGWFRLDGFNVNVKLQWSSPYCRSCEAVGRSCGFKEDTGLAVGCSGVTANGLSTNAKYGITMGLGIPGLVCAICLLCYARRKSNGNTPHRHHHHHHHPALEFNSTAVAPQPEVLVAAGLDGPTIESYPKTVLGQSRRLPRSDDCICPICLSEYRPKEALRTMPECNHFFHARCIDSWLKLNPTCPLCRKTTPDNSLSHTSRSSQSWA